MIRFLMRGRLPLALFVMTSWAAAQGSVFVVDWSNGPGTDFTNVRAAIDAVPAGSTLLVRSGVHVLPELSQHPLSIVADTGAEVVFSGGMRIEDVNTGVTLVQGIDMSPSFGGPASVSARLSNGALWIENCRTERITLERCGNVMLVRNTVEPSGVRPYGFFPPSAISSASSTCSVLACQVLGLDGAPGGSFFFGFVLGSPGASGFTLEDGGTAFLAGNSVAAGNGGQGMDNGGGVYPECGRGGDGGSAIVVDAIDAVVRELDNTLVAGRPGFGGQDLPPADPCDPGIVGLPIDHGQNVATVTSLRGGFRGVQASSPVREGESITLTLTGSPGDMVFVMWAMSPTTEQVFAPDLNGVCLIGTPTQSLGMNVLLPASGTATILIPVPDLGLGIESAPMFFTAWFQPATGPGQLGAASASMLLDDSF